MSALSQTLDTWRTLARMQYTFYKETAEGMRDASKRISVFMMLMHDKEAVRNPLHAVLNQDVLSLVYIELKRLVMADIARSYDSLSSEHTLSRMRLSISMIMFDIKWEECNDEAPATVAGSA